MDGDSSYNRRHKQGHFKGDSIPSGALVDFMPQPDYKVLSIRAKTIPGVFIGYHIHAGGLWSGDYLVADLAPFRQDCDVAKSKVKVHRIKEVVKNTWANSPTLSRSGDRRESLTTRILEHLLTRKCPGCIGTPATTRLLLLLLAVAPTGFRPKGRTRSPLLTQTTPRPQGLLRRRVGCHRRMD